MPRGRKKQDEQELTGEALLEEMRATRDVLVEKIKRGYGDERNRSDIERWREIARDFAIHHPVQWAEIAAERPRATDAELASERCG